MSKFIISAFVLFFSLTCNAQESNKLDSLGHKFGHWNELAFDSAGHIFGVSAYYLAGHLHGPYVASSSDILYMSGTYFQGKKNGAFTFFDTLSMQIIRIENYRNDTLESIQKYYHGILVESYGIRNGMEHGQHIWYGKNGVPIRVADFYNGQLNGNDIYYWPNGAYRTIATYSNGYSVQTVHYDKKGKVEKVVMPK